MRRKKFKGIVVGGLLCATVVPSSRAMAGDLAGVPAYNQTQSNICWATAVQIVAKKIVNTNRTQCQYVNSGKQVSNCPNLGGSTDDIHRALTSGGLTTGSVVSPPSLYFSTFRTEIDAGYPVIFNIGYHTGSYHQIVGMGHQTLPNGQNWAKSIFIQWVAGDPNAFPPPEGSRTEYREWSNFLNNSSYWVTNMRYNFRPGGK